MNLAVVFVDEEYGIMVHKFYGMYDMVKDYITFTEDVFGWRGMHLSTLSTLTEDKVFCFDIESSIAGAKELILDDYANRVLELKQELSQLESTRDKIIHQKVVVV